MDVEPFGVAAVAAPAQHVLPPRIVMAHGHVVGHDVDHDAHALCVQALVQLAQSGFAPQFGIDAGGIHHIIAMGGTGARHQDGRKIEVADAQAVVVVHRRGRLLETEITVQLQPRGGARDAAVRRRVWRYGRGWHQISLAVPPRTRRRRSSLALAA